MTVKFSGSYTALVTPFRNGEVDEAAFRKLIYRPMLEAKKSTIK